MSEPQPDDRRDMTILQKLSVPEAADPPWSILTATLIVLVLLVNLILIGPSMSSVVLGFEDNVITPFMLLLGWTLGQALTVLYVVINRRSSRESWQALKLRKGYLPLPFVLMVGVATALAINLVINLASGQFLPIPEIYGFQTEGIAGAVVAGLLLILIQPVAESLVFQGVLLPKLRVMMGPWGGTIVTTVVFTVLHYAVFYASYQPTYPPSTLIWYGVVYPLIAGLTFCLIKVYTGSTRAVIIARAGAGLIFLLTALVLVSG